METLMKAIVYEKYGLSDVLQLKEVPEAMRYFGEGLVRGKVVITLGDSNIDQ